MPIFEMEGQDTDFGTDVRIISCYFKCCSLVFNCSTILSMEEQDTDFGTDVRIISCYFKCCSLVFNCSTIYINGRQTY
ncbi:MAG: hypothetical protein F6K39_16805 [Okeania sp. SIO3B3]|nr:hypothetical protein [Okeania sp. SIO3B3]